MEQTDNLDKSPDVLDSVTGQSDNQINDPGDFFSELDNQVNGLVVNSDNQQSQQITSKDLKARSTSPVAEVSNPDELKTLEKRYADSSREAKRLNNRLKELETYAPLLDRFREDPNLISTVRDYIDGSANKGIKERMGMSDDFVFDPDEAISDPKSDSAKVFDSVVNQKVQSVVSGRLDAEKKQQQVQSQASEFKSKHSMSDEQFEEFMRFAGSRPLNYDDIYYLMNKDNRDTNIASETRREVASQMQNVRNRPQSLASGGTAPSDEETKVEDAIFDSMLNEGLDNMFT
tara:strand:- start:23974 stop:24840 length:867 start_codon:yes stop_codon:yes gene_type:complete